MATGDEGNPKDPFSIATTPRCRGGRYSFPWIAPLDSTLIMLSVEQDSIKYHFLSLWYDSTWDWTQISRTIGKHFNHHANVRVLLCQCPGIEYLGILEAYTIKQVEIKEKKLKKEYIRRTRKLLQTKLCSRNLVKGINAWAVLLVRYSGPFLKWTGEEHKKIDQRHPQKNSQWSCIRHCILEMTLTMCEKKRGGTCRHWRQRWRIDTTTRRQHRKVRMKKDYSYQKQY